MTFTEHLAGILGVAHVIVLTWAALGPLTLTREDIENERMYRTER